MKKQLIVHIFGLMFVSANVFATPAIATADRYFTSSNISALSGIYNVNRENRGIAYLYAKAMLNKNDTTAGERFISGGLNDYMRNDILHQLINFYYTNRSFLNYQRVFKLLPENQQTMNEKCGMDTATQTITVDTAYIAKNNVPIWCANLIANGYLQGSIHKEQRDLMLYNLIANDKNGIFIQLAPSLGIKSVNFNRYKNVSANKLPANDFLVINRITDIGHKNPDQASLELKGADVSDKANTFLNNYLAMQYAQKHDFKQAIRLYEKYGENLSDDQAEWLARSYLYSSRWKDLISTIDSMPKNLNSKNVWLYWEAKAYDNLNNSAKAGEYLKRIPNDYSYYSMLANAELGSSTVYKTSPPKNMDLDDSNSGKSAQIGLDLYIAGKNSGSKHLMNIGSAEWNYAAKSTDDDDLLLAMSNLTKKSGLYDLSIYAANQMDDRYIELSFPLPFMASFARYSKSYGIDPTYALAISRQESRFNYWVIAFDGGVGLMQIMPQTATYISRKSGSKNCYREGPECNIKFGAWYLGSLYGKFGNLIYSTAAYNAGPNRSRRWQDSLGSLDNRIQIELIPISITRDYVQKVLSNKAIYDNEIKGNTKINMAEYVGNIGKQHYLNVPDDDNTDADKLK